MAQYWNFALLFGIVWHKVGVEVIGILLFISMTAYILKFMILGGICSKMKFTSKLVIKTKQKLCKFSRTKEIQNSKQKLSFGQHLLRFCGQLGELQLRLRLRVRANQESTDFLTKKWPDIVQAFENFHNIFIPFSF